MANFGTPEVEAVKMSVSSVWFIMAADKPRGKLPARDILAELVAVEPKLTSVVSEKGERTPEFNCHLLDPAVISEVRPMVPPLLGRVQVLSAERSAEVKLPVN